MGQRCRFHYLAGVRRAHEDFAARYGAWAVVAGASEGLGAAFADALAARRTNLLLLARRVGVLDEVAERIRGQRGVSVRTLPMDVADPGVASAIAEAASELEIGVLVCNAAFSPIGKFLDLPLDDLLHIVDVNVRAPLVFVRTLVPPMLERRRGAVVLMSSLAGLQGSPRIATYAASKAFNTILAEGLWGELHASGIDVLASCAGAIRTPGYADASLRDAPGTLDPAEVAEQTLAAVGRGPRVVPGWVNRIASVVTGRVLPRRLAVRMMAASTRNLT
jgi:short-subunit dehydrogenase